MKGNCELFNKGCTGCEGLQYDIDKIKMQCETYQEYVKKYDEGEQIKWN